MDNFVHACAQKGSSWCVKRYDVAEGSQIVFINIVDCVDRSIMGSNNSFQTFISRVC